MVSNRFEKKDCFLLSKAKSGCHLPSSLEKKLMAYFSQGQGEGKKLENWHFSFDLLSSVGRNTKDIFVNGKPEAKSSLGSLAEEQKLFWKQYLFSVGLERCYRHEDLSSLPKSHF